MNDKETVEVTLRYRDVEVPISLSVTKKQATTLQQGAKVAVAIRDAIIALAEEGDEETG